MKGYDGILRVDLTTKSIGVEPIPDELARQYLGTRGIGTRILYDEIPSGAHPLGEENKLVFITGPLVGSGIPGTSRYTVMAKSPLTGFLGEGTAGGFFGREMRRAGISAIVIEGKASTPVYVWVTGNGAELRDASHLWGKDTNEVEDIIRAETGCSQARVASIGKGGENLVLYASIMSDKARAIGRCGLGAVMGAKNLKAVAVWGSRSPQVHDPDAFQRIHRLIRKMLSESPYAQSRKKIGSSETIRINNELGMLPTYNFRTGRFSEVEKITGETLMKTIYTRAWSCANCPVGSGKRVKIQEGPFAPVSDEFKGPEYETIAAFGSLCGNSDLASIAKANELCTRYSIDTISAGVSIAFAMECYEKGIITKQDTEGLEITWGKPELIVRLVEMIARHEGFGAVLSQGVKRMAMQFGRGSDDFAMEVKGLEFPMHDPRGKNGLAITYATSNRGACHTFAVHDTFFKVKDRIPEVGLIDVIDPYSMAGKAAFSKKAQEFYTIITMLPMCNWVAPPRNLITLSHIVEVLEAVTGWHVTPEELMLIAERTINLGRLFNVKHGLKRDDDRLPKRMFEPLDTLGGRCIDPEEFEAELREYYRLRGWDEETGKPSVAKLVELGL